MNGILVCNFSSSVSSLLSDPGCLPEIYLVSGHSSCSSLPQSVTAKKLAEIHQTGAGQTLVDLSWSELTDTCVIIVRKKSCDDSEDVVVADTTETPEDTTSLSFRDTCEQLRLVPATLFRTFTTINLSGFNILLSGSTGKWPALTLIQIHFVPHSQNHQHCLSPPWRDALLRRSDGD